MIRAFLFDLDGTLVLSEHLKSRSYAHAIRDLREDQTSDAEVLEVYKQQVGQTREKMSIFLMESFGLVDTCERLLPVYDVERPWQVLASLRMDYYGAMIADPNLMREYERPHSTALLRNAQERGYRLALATSSQTPEANRVLESLRIRDCFQEVIGADQVQHHKPDPEVYLLAASRLDIPPEECLVIEDTTTGVSAGLAAGMHVVATSNDLTEQSLMRHEGFDQRWHVRDPQNLQSVVDHLIQQQGQST
jgi:beta-phosphoglucomutase-like phosphatase (HAD superfamily)